MPINKKDFVKTIKKNVSGEQMHKMPDGHMMSDKEMTTMMKKK